MPPRPMAWLYPVETASSRGARSASARRRMRSSISTDSARKATGSALSSHHSGVTRPNGHRARLEAGDRGVRAVVGDEEAGGEAQDVHHPLEGPADPIWHCAQDDIHSDVLPAPKQPRCGKHGDEVEHRLGDLVAPLEA